MIKYEDSCKITNTATDIEVDADVMNFRLEDGLTVAVAGNKIVLKYNKKHNIYIGNALGMEFTSKGPKYYDVNQGRF